MPEFSLSQEQIEQRLRGVTASEMPAVLGISRYDTALDVYNLKIYGDLIPRRDSPQMRAGRHAQEYIKSLYEQERGDYLEPAVTITSEEHPWIVATPDYIHLNWDGNPLKIVEIKNVGLRQMKHWGRAGTDQVPVEPLVQVMTQMLVTGIRSAEIAALLGGDTLRIYPIEYDEDLAREIIERSRTFWFEHVQKREPPPCPNPKSVARHLGLRFKEIEYEELEEASIETDFLVEDYRRARQAKRDADEDLTRIENLIKEVVGNRRGLIRQGDYKITWTQMKRGETSYRKFQVQDLNDRFSSDRE